MDVGLHRTYVGSVERGERNVSLANIHKLATALDISLEELFRRVEAAMVTDVAHGSSRTQRRAR